MITMTIAEITEEVARSNERGTTAILLSHATALGVGLANGGVCGFEFAMGNAAPGTVLRAAAIHGADTLALSASLYGISRKHGFAFESFEKTLEDVVYGGHMRNLYVAEAIGVAVGYAAGAICRR
jgi:hypothetical protein